MKFLKLLIILVFLVGCQKAVKKDENKTSVGENRVSFTAVGDNLMHEKLLDEAKQGNGYDFMPYYQNIKPYIQKADLSFVNQETILGGNQLGASGYPNFNTPDIMANNLNEVGFDIVNGATNHTLDKGYSAVQHSIEEFKKYSQMEYIGLYESQEDRDNVQVVAKNGLRIALLSYNQLSNNKSYPNSYFMNFFDENKIRKDVENAKEVSDFVVVSAHWGSEYDVEPNSFQKKYATIFADAGVDVVIGTHSHTLQPVEWIEGKGGHRTLMAYSLGNFVHGMMEEETQLGGMLSFDFVKKDNKLSIDNVVLTPLINHYEASNKKNVYDSRNSFTVYRLKDYSEELALKHGLNGYQGIQISVSKMKEKVTNRISSGINIDM